MGRERSECELSQVERLMRCAEMQHVVTYGEEHPLTLGRVQRGRFRAMAHELLRAHGFLGRWDDALAAFYADGYWRQFGHPFAAFVRQAARYMREARRTEDGTRARKRADEEFERDMREFGSRGAGQGTGRQRPG